MSHPSTPLHIGSLRLATPLLLAPLAGYSDLPFRAMVREQGGLGLAFTEMIRAGGLLHGRAQKAAFILATDPDDAPLGWQIYGRDPADMAAAAQVLEARGARLIDLNMGCPQKKIAGRGDGAGLLKTPDRAAAIAQAVVRAVSVPVTVKIRLGWDAGHRIGLDLARRLADAGVAGLIVHGRTAGQMFGGEADWEAIAAIAASLPGLPVIGNGDIAAPETARQRLAESGCAGLLIGRGALKNPWLIRDIARALEGLPPLPRPSGEAARAAVLRHFDRQAAFYGPEKGALWFRKWIPLYVRRTLKMERPEMVRLLTLSGHDALRNALASLPLPPAVSPS